MMPLRWFTGFMTFPVVLKYSIRQIQRVLLDISFVEIESAHTAMPLCSFFKKMDFNLKQQQNL